jgi:hypothetical protein
VCALHELQRTLVVRSEKSLKIQTFLLAVSTSVNNFPEGAGPLYAEVTLNIAKQSRTPIKKS